MTPSLRPQTSSLLHAPTMTGVEVLAFTRCYERLDPLGGQLDHQLAVHHASPYRLAAASVALGTGISSRVGPNSPVGRPPARRHISAS